MEDREIKTKKCLCKQCGKIEVYKLGPGFCELCQEQRKVEKTSIKLGDKIAAATTVLGIKQCGGCKARQAALNRVKLSEPVGKVLTDLWQAITNPEENTKQSDKK